MFTNPIVLLLLVVDELLLLYLNEFNLLHHCHNLMFINEIKGGGGDVR